MTKGEHIMSRPPRPVALVTGASRNVGRSIALRMAASGCDVAVTSLRAAAELDAIRGQVEEQGARCFAALADLTKSTEVDRLVAGVAESLGSPDIVIHTTAVRPHQDLESISDADWYFVMDSILSSAFFLARAVLPPMAERGWGRLVLFSGTAAFAGAVHQAHVVAGKLAVVGLSRALALDYARRGVTVNTISPGLLDTERNPSWHMPSGSVLPNPLAGAPVPPPPAGRLGTVQEIASACEFLASSASGYLTGQCLHVNGGSFLGG